MNQSSLLVDVKPTNLAELKNVIKELDPDNQLKPVGMKKIEIKKNALDELVEGIKELSNHENVLLVEDSTYMLRKGESLKEHVFTILTNEFTVKRLVLGANGKSLVADEATIDQVKSYVTDDCTLVVVGSGTIVDICKDATLNKEIPLVVVQTAASVNAFSDDMAVLLKEGVKRTVPSRWPDFLLIDLDIIRDAPKEMNIAGYGDLMAMWTAPADWYLASQLGMDNSYHSAPVDLLIDQGKELINNAKSIGNKEDEGLLQLANLLTLSGISLGIAGSTAPLSGTEHLISHLIDMDAKQKKREAALHGAQIGIATIPVSLAWKEFIEKFNPTSIDFEKINPKPEEFKERVMNAFNKIDPTGQVGEECWADVSKKLDKWIKCKDNFSEFIKNWDIHKVKLSNIVQDPNLIVEALENVGAPTTINNVTPSIDFDTYKWALTNCHLMRNRFTISDLLFFINWWNEDFIDNLITNTDLLTTKK